MTKIIDLSVKEKIYKSKMAQISILNGFRLEVAAGEKIAIVGESGAGKSSLLNIIGLLDRNYSGEYTLFGSPTDQLHTNQLAQWRNQRIGFVLQESALIKQKSAKRTKLVNNIIVHIVLAVLAAVWVFPVLWGIMTSFRAEKGSYVSSFFPKSYTLDNYVKRFTDTTLLNFPKMFMNTLVIAIFSCLLSTFLLLSVSYCLSRMRFKMRKPYMNMAMILGLFPGFMSMVAVYFILKAVGLTEGNLIRVALVLCYSGGAAIGFQVAKGFFDTTPYAIDEAAMLDGCTRWQIFTKITLPLSKPIVIYTILTSFIGPWVDFIFAKVICRANADQYTVAIGLWRMLEKEYIDNWYTCFAAGAVLISIPIALLFLKLQKYYVNGTGGAVKG